MHANDSQANMNLSAKLLLNSPISSSKKLPLEEKASQIFLVKLIIQVELESRCLNLSKALTSEFDWLPDLMADHVLEKLEEIQVKMLETLFINLLQSPGF